MVASDNFLYNNIKNIFRNTVKGTKVNPASIDVCLGSHVIAFSYRIPFWLKIVNLFLNDTDRFSLQKKFAVEEIHTYYSPTDEIVFFPNVFYLCTTQEYINVPETHAALLLLKSSRGRESLQHAFSGWVDPGFHGELTYEFTCTIPVKYKVGTPMAQLVFFQLDEIPNKDYTETGKYNGQTGATLSKD